MNDRGSAAIEFITLTVVILVPLFYAVVAVFDVQRASYAVTSASMAGARAFTAAADPVSGEQQLRRAAKLALSDFGVTDAEITVSCTPRCFVAGSTVIVSVRTEKRLPLVPEWFGTSLASVEVTSLHEEPFGTYRASAS